MKLRITQQHDAVTYKGNGKLLITGEYFVLDGAQALAIPTKYGQTLRVKELHASDSTLYWIALNSKGEVWLNLVFDTKEFECINAKTPEAERLSKMLREARKLNPNFITDGKDRAVETKLEFPNEWGLGSSSTLIHCLATWAEIDGYTLSQNTIGGSGYDVAAAGYDTPILYQIENCIPHATPIHWSPPFIDNIYFAYQGHKQLTAEGLKHYKNELKDKTQAVNQLSYITQQLLKCTDLDTFEALVYEHENIVASNLKFVKVKDSLFSDYWGSVKSLGAWGGDYVMMTNTRSYHELREYLKAKNITTVFRWHELIIPQA